MVSLSRQGFGWIFNTGAGAHAFVDKRRAAVNQAAVDLHRLGAERPLLGGIGTAYNAAHADKWDAAMQVLRQLLQDVVAFFTHRQAG